MLERRQVEEIDKFGIHIEYENWPLHCRSALNLEVNCPEVGSVDQLVFAGMGGSAIPGDIISDWLYATSSIPIYVIKDYHLPKFVGTRSLILAISLSGDTEETLSIINEAVHMKATIATISSGGLLETISNRKKISFTKVKKILVPRASLPYLIYPSLRLLNELHIVDRQWDEVLNSINAIEVICKQISVDVPVEHNPAKDIALKIHDGLPLIYTSHLNRAVGLRFKDSLNENAKMHAIADVVPELCHNEVVGLETTDISKRIPIFIRYKGEPPEVEARFDALKDVAESVGYNVYEIWGVGTDSLSIILSTLYLLDYASIYAAVVRGIDPIPTRSINMIKENMNSKLNYLTRFTDSLKD